ASLQVGEEVEAFDAPIPSSTGNEELESFFEDRGPESAMNWIVKNRPDLIEDAIQVWSGYDEVSATRFATRYDRFLEQEQAKETQQVPGEDPFLSQMKQQAAFTQ